MQLTLSEWADISKIAGTVIALIALAYTAVQLRQNTLVRRAQFHLELEKMFSAHDQIHLYLRPGGRWSDQVSGPRDASEWGALEDYMGLFEHCEAMMQKKLVDKDIFKAIFSYRLSNILANRTIVNAKFIDEQERWTLFLSLLKRFDVSVPDAG